MSAARIAGAVALGGLVACTAILGAEEGALRVSPEAGACPEGRTSCDGGAACAVDLARDPANCGSCGHACGGAHAIGGCVEGNCVLTCERGYCDQNALLEDGCESPSSTDPTSCGVCGKSCAGGRCEDGVCQPVALGKFGTAGGDLVNAGPEAVFTNVRGATVDGGVEWGLVMRVGLDGSRTRVPVAPTANDALRFHPATSRLGNAAGELQLLGSDPAATSWTLASTDPKTGSSRCVGRFRAAAYIAPGPLQDVRAPEALLWRSAGDDVVVASLAPGATRVEVRRLPVPSSSCAAGEIAPFAAFDGAGLGGLATTDDGRIWVSSGPGLVSIGPGGDLQTVSTSIPVIAANGGDVYGAFPDLSLRRLTSAGACGDAGACGEVVATALGTASSSEIRPLRVALSRERAAVLFGGQFSANKTPSLSVVTLATGATSNFQLQGVLPNVGPSAALFTEAGDGLFVSFGDGSIYYLKL